MGATMMPRRWFAVVQGERLMTTAMNAANGVHQRWVRTGGTEDLSWPRWAVEQTRWCWCVSVSVDSDELGVGDAATVSDFDGIKG